MQPPENTRSSQERRITLEPPDGGWGWCIVLGTCLINLVTRSIEPSFGLLFGDVLQDLGVATTGAAVIVSSRDAVINFSGFFVGPLMKKYSYRTVGVLGAILTSLGLIAVASAHSMTYILISYSLLGGFGFGLIATATFVALNSYFIKKRGQAFGLSMTGTALGFMVVPQIISRLLEYYGFYGTMMVMGAMGLHALVGALLLQPVERHMKKVVVEEKETLLDHSNKKEENDKSDYKEEDNSKQESALCGTSNRNSSYSASPILQKKLTQSCLSLRFKNSTLSIVSYLDLTDSALQIPFVTQEGGDNKYPDKSEKCKYIDADHGTNDFGKSSALSEKPIDNKSEKVEEKEDSCWKKFISFMDFDLLKRITFLNIIFGLSMAYIAEVNFKFVIPFFMANLGYSKRDTAQALSLMAIADIVARLFIPPICDRLPYSRRKTLAVGLVFMMIARSVLAEQSSWNNLIVAIAVHGFFRGFALINFPLVLSESVERDKLPSAYGLYMVFKGICVVAFGPLAGWIRDYTGSYAICLHVQSLIILISVTAWALESILISQKDSRKNSDLAC